MLLSKMHCETFQLSKLLQDLELEVDIITDPPQVKRVECILIVRGDPPHFPLLDASASA